MVDMTTPDALGANPGGGDRSPTAFHGFRAAEYISGIRSQPWLWLASLLAFNLLLVAVVATLELRYGVDHWNLMRDTNAIAGQPTYYGFYSNIGVLLWALAASVALFGALSLRRLGIQGRRVRTLFLGGAFAGVAGVGDLFKLHQNAGWIGLSEKAVMAGYALFLLVFVASAIPIAHRTKWILLAGSLASLAASMIVDQLHLTMPGRLVIEESFKLTGITLLAAYLVTLSYSLVAEHCRPQRGALDES